MTKRRLILGDYDTAADGLWTLSALKVKKAAQAQTFIDVPGRYAPLDVSTYLTDGEPIYGSAGLEAVLESSEGDRLERQDRLDVLVSYLDGKNVQIIHPDHPDHYMVGRVQVEPAYNDLAHCAVNVSAVCEPWMYALTETVVKLTAGEAVQTARLVNSGRLAVVPTLVVTGTVDLAYGDNSWSLNAGTYTLPELYLTPGTGPVMPGVHEITYSGAGTLTITYREAVLAA